MNPPGPRSARISAALLLPVTLLLLSLQGCGDGGGITSPEVKSEITFDFAGLETLPEGLNYQAWLVAGDGQDFWGYPLVIFDIDQDGQMVDPVADTILSGPFPAGLDPDEVWAVAVSLELSANLQSYSSYTFLLGGAVTQGTAILSPVNFFSFQEPLSSIEGHFILQTPTDEDPGNEASGVWFMDPSSDPVEAGLKLPEAPEGWNYESWIVLDTEPLSMGKFPSPAASDSSAVHGGALPQPEFPGNDFLEDPPQGLSFPQDLSGKSIFVTLEPWQEWDTHRATPFFLRLLEAQIPPDAIPGTLYDMTPLSDALPTGTATIQGF